MECFPKAALVYGPKCSSGRTDMHVPCSFIKDTTQIGWNLYIEQILKISVAYSSFSNGVTFSNTL